MLIGVYSIYDSKSQVYQAPFYAVNDDVAVRTVYDSFVHADSVISRHPEDFTLFRLADFDDTRGLLIPCERVFVSDLLALLAQPVSEVEDDG